MLLGRLMNYKPVSIKTKETLVSDIEALKQYLSILHFDTNKTWGNAELRVFDKVSKLANSLGAVQQTIKKQYVYPKPIKLTRPLKISLNEHWKSLIKSFQNNPGVVDLGEAIKKGEPSYWGNIRETTIRRFSIPAGTLGFLTGITPVDLKVKYLIVIPEPNSYKIKKSNYIEIEDEYHFTFNVSEAEKQLLKKGALSLLVGYNRDNLALVEKVDDLIKTW